MHIDARNLDDDTRLEGDICIIGAGAAGISLALEWADTAHRVLLLEGGGFDFEPAMQDLYRGDIVGQPYFPMEAARLHYFGGTTGHWAGFCAPLDPMDFEVRPWVPHSGWPISRTDLDPFYARAQHLLQLSRYEYDAAYWEAQDPSMARLPLDEERIWSKIWQISPPTRFGTVYREAVSDARNIHLYTYANVVEIEANEAGAAVQGLRVRTPEGQEHTVRARHYVLACGAIQNARLLLASQRQTPAGLGNANYLVGRFFMEHIEMTGGQLSLTAPGPMGMYVMSARPDRAIRARAELALSASEQRRRQVLNCTTSPSPGKIAGNLTSQFARFTPEMLEGQIRARSSGQARARPRTSTGTEIVSQRDYRLFTRQEQSPNPNSRITLSEDKDALGMPRVRLDWQLTELDQRSIREFYLALGEEMGRSGLGRVQLADWLLDGDDRAWPAFLGGGWHHMGTTRMHDNPSEGVVDSDCKVHGISNLHVAGSATFATSGTANPTLSVVALSLRLSDQLKTLV